MSVIEACALFETLAESTWRRLAAGISANCSQGEETITDINLLEIMDAKLSNVKVRKINKNEEANTGLDWEWWIGNYDRGYWRYAVQAKKLNKNERYDGIRHKVGTEFQINLLKQYATANHCVPLYCLYNYISTTDCSIYWGCGLNYDRLQLGCTVVPIDAIETVFQRYQPKTFHSIHSKQFHNKSALPWRCLVKCPRINMQNSIDPHMLAPDEYVGVRRFDSVPDFLHADAGGTDLEFSNNFYDTNINTSKACNVNQS